MKMISQLYKTKIKAISTKPLKVIKTNLTGNNFGYNKI